MTSPKTKGDEKSLPPKQSTVLLLLTIADTTWRAFIPTVGLTIVGLVGDKLLGTKPWLMILGIVIGAALAVWLVRLQMKKVKNI